MGSREYNKSQYDRIINEIFRELDVKLSGELRELFDKIYFVYINKSADSPFEIIRNRTSRNNGDELYEIIYAGVQGALKSITYSLGMFIRNASYLKSKSIELKEYAVLLGYSAVAIPTDNKLTYEYENFMIHSQILVDRLCWFLSYFFDVKAPYMHNLYPYLKENAANDTLKQKIVAKIKEYSHILMPPFCELLDEDATERNIIAHRKEIMAGTVNICFLQGSTVEPRILRPISEKALKMIQNGESHKLTGEMLTDVDADLWIVNQYNELLSAVTHIIKIFFNWD